MAHVLKLNNLIQSLPSFDKFSSIEFLIDSCIRYHSLKTLISTILNLSSSIEEEPSFLTNFISFDGFALLPTTNAIQRVSK